VDKDLPALHPFLNETVGNSEMLFRILVVLIVDLDVQVLKILPPLHVLAACDIQDVSDPSLYQLFSFEPCLERTHEYAVVDLEQVDVSKRNGALDIAGAHVEVGETAANDLVFLASVRVLGIWI